MFRATVLGLLALAVLTCVPYGTPARAQSTSGKSQAQADQDIIIRGIRIEGTNRIERETVSSYLLLKPGDKFSDERLDRSLKSLFATGLFADVTLRREGDVLVVRVVENPIINRLAFEGNKKITDENLRAEVQLRPRVVYTRTKVQTDTKRILDLYRLSGRFAATVEPKVIPLEQNRVDLVFEINEGEVTGVRRIAFIGNRRFTDSKLREVIRTTESVWWRFLTTEDTYDPDRLTFDQELLRRFYLSRGYADFRNVSVVAELTPDREDFFITFTLEEGERYKFGTVDVTTGLANIDTEALRSVVTTEEGDWYNGDEVEKSITNLTDELGTLGYAFVEVRPRIERDRDALTVAIDYNIQEGPKVFVERINIIGNTRSRDEVIRREMRLAEGDAFNTAKIRESRRRIRRLDYFEEVEITNGPGSAPDQTIVTVEVKEKSTGELSAGAGFSSSDGAIGTVGLRERNFLGRGLDVSASFAISQRTQAIDLKYTEPYFLDRNLSAGFDVFRTDRDFEDEGGFDQQTTGFRLRSGYEITDDLSQSWSYTLSRNRLENIDASASIFVRAAEGTTVTSAVGQTLLLDRTNDRLDPTEGYIAKLGVDVAGLGGTERYVRPEVSGAYYIPIVEDWVASVSGKAGIIRGIGKDVNISDRFFVGQEEIRGFQVGGIGPRDSVSDDALGANNFYAASVELSFPLGLPKELGIKGRVFTDFGSAFGLDDSSSRILDEASPRVSAGVGVSWDSPFGPVRVDVGFPLVKEDFDKEELFRFSFGTRF